MNRIIKNITFLFLLLLAVVAVQAQVDDKGVTSTGKEVDCSTINPSVDQTVDQYGAIVTRPTLTRNGKLITRDCYCPFDLGDGNASITDFVYCTSVKMFAELSYRDPEARELPNNARVYVFTDAAYTHCVDTVAPAVIEHPEGKDTLTVDITDLNCYTRYYFRLVATNTTECVFEWNDSTRDATLEKVTTCDVLANLTNEHLYETGKIDSVYDHQGNAYAVVQINGVCVMRQNMRCINGPSESNTYQIVSNAGDNTESHSNPIIRYPNNDNNLVNEYGLLYNYPAALDVTGQPTTFEKNYRGICPYGWHLPSVEEINAILVGITPDQLAAGCDWNPSDNSDVPGNYNESDRNTTGFSLLPVGSWNNSDRYKFGSCAYYWTISQPDSRSPNEAFGYHFEHNWGSQMHCTSNRIDGYAVRCLRNAPDTITFISNNGVNDTMRQLAMRGATTQLDPATFTYENHVFAKWNTNRKGSGTAYTDTASIVVNGNITLYAQWNTSCTALIALNENSEKGVGNRIDSVRDHQGHSYAVVTINGLCIMKQNLRVTTRPNGGTLVNSNSSVTNQSCYWKNPTFGNEGYLYNWRAALDYTSDVANIAKGKNFENRRGLCPEGWHLPTLAEWQNISRGHDAGQFAAPNSSYTGTNWNSSNIDNTPGNTNDPDKNATEFYGIPVGSFYNGAKHNEGLYANFWSASAHDTEAGKARCRYLKSDNASFSSNSTNNRGDGFSVRCMRNPEYAVVPTVDSVSCTSMNVSAQVIGLGDLNAKTIKLYTDEDCTTGEVVGTVTADENTISANFTNLSCNTRYYIKVTATDGSHSVEAVITDSTRDMTMEKATYCTVASVRAWNGTDSDQSREHLVEGSTTEIDSVYDHQGNAYAVVQIGNQCWLKENMRATTKLDGTSILQNPASGSSNTEQRAYFYSNDSSNYVKYGCLYNWPAAMNGAANEGARGICPQGWHVPNDAEWRTLATNAGVGQDSGTGLGKLTGGCDWSSNGSGSQSYPGNYSYTDRNSTGFSALPAGYYYSSSFSEVGTDAYFWSATSNDNYNAYRWNFYYKKEFVGPYGTNRSYGFSVRCVRDAQAKNYCTVDLKLDNENSSVAGRIDSVSDHEGNWYKVVEIGEQCWLAENMRATTEPTDPTKSIVFNSSVGSSSTEPRAFYYLNNEANYAKYGALYNFPATMNYTGDLPAFVHPHRGICPEGWHVPEDAEWTTMEKTVAPDGTGLHNNLTVDILLNNADYQASNTDLAVRLSSGNDWDGNGYAGITPNSYDNSSRNSTGFSALPAGDYRNAFYDINQNAYFMSSTIWNFNSTPLVICRGLYYMYSGMNRNAYNLTSYYSLRCVRNTPASATINFHANGGTGTMEAMSVTTMTNTVLSANSFTHEGNWAFTGWNTKMDGTGTAYDDQAHITPTESITLYAQWHTWCDASSVRAQSGTDLSHEHGYNGATDKIDSVYDHQGNAYAVVQIGNQCWLKENMRATTSPRQGVVNLIEGTSGSDKDNPRYYDCGPNKYSGQVVTNDRARGYLYNWAAAIDTSNASSITNDLPNRRGICPAGWHVPTNGELTAMSSLAGVGKEETSKGLGKLTGGCDWNTSSSATAPGNYSYSERNSTGFSALPVGFYDGSRCTNAGDYAYFWSATPKDGNDAYYRRLYYNYEYVNITSNPKEYGYSVRCVRNN